MLGKSKSETTSFLKVSNFREPCYPVGIEHFLDIYSITYSPPIQRLKLNIGSVLCNAA
jgi:hypothetical protein